MENHLYSIEKVARLLDVHQKTVLRYIKEGKLHANKVGGRWRIHGNDLTSFVGINKSPESEPPARQKPKAEVTPEPWVSSVVHAENLDREESIRISNTLMALTAADTGEKIRCRVDTVYFEDDLKLQILIWGTLDFNSQLLKVLEGVIR